jgi:hypothetical protein
MNEQQRATGAIVPERQRCICDGICLDHCRACNHSGRDLEECCIADPDWEADDDDLARRMTAEHQGSDESGGGLRAIGRVLDLDGQVDHARARAESAEAALATARREVEEAEREREAEEDRANENATLVHQARAERDDLRARQVAVVRDIEAERSRRWQKHLTDHPYSDGSSCPRDYGEHDALHAAAEIARAALANPSAAQGEPQSHYDAVCDYEAALGSRDPERIEAAGRALNASIQREHAALSARVRARSGVEAPTWADLLADWTQQLDTEGAVARSVLSAERCPKSWCGYPMPHDHTEGTPSAAQGEGEVGK